MSLLIKASGLCKTFGHFDIFRDVSFTLARRDRVGLIGPNGAGKSTLLKLLLGEELQDSGHVSRPGHPVIGYLPQEARFAGALTVYDAVTSGLTLNPPDWEIAEILSQFQFEASRWDQMANTLSGGEQTRLMLARLLLSQPDLLLLDEPTNHLDFRMLEWLETYLSRYRGAVLTVSHDRRFLDRTVKRILEIEGGKLREFSGNYHFYVEKKEEERRRQRIDYQRQQEEIQALQEFIGRALGRARSLTQGPKRGRDHYGRVAEKVAKQAKAAEKRLDRIDRVTKPWESDTLHARFLPEERLGQWAIHTSGLTRRFGDHFLFEDVNLDIAHGERVGIMGPNGSGKTTLLRTLLGEESPDAGVTRLGTAMKAGYLAQHQENLNPTNSLLEEVMSERSATETEVRNLLACFLFRRDEVFKKVESLSLGERVRLALAKLLASGCNLMVLDEPTHHLDIATRERMERALESYTGTLLVVSHDRLLLDRLVDRLIVLEHGTLTQYRGTYSDYVNRGRDEEWIAGAMKAIDARECM